MGWEAFTRVTNDGVRIVAFDHELLEGAPVASLPVACEVVVRDEPMLSRELAATESEIESTAAGLDGRVVGHIRSRSEVWTLLYLPSDEHADRLARVRLPRSASLSVAPALDPLWTLFDRVRPVLMEAQSMLDHRQFGALIKAGDAGGRRRVEHVVADVVPDQVDEFVRAVASLGGSVSEQRDGNIQIVLEAEPTGITEDAWTVRLIAERFGATYDGWACEVARDDEPSGRRWFRRR